jgi:hypothetical protein
MESGMSPGLPQSARSHVLLSLHLVMVNVWKLAVILSGCSLLLPLIALIAFLLELPDDYTQVGRLTSLFTAFGSHSLPPTLKQTVFDRIQKACWNEPRL